MPVARANLKQVVARVGRHYASASRVLSVSAPHAVRGNPLYAAAIDLNGNRSGA